ncbi:MAG: hypothetical protein WCJ64_02245 [Rhodospirillaceae bacterium]
MTIQKIVRPGVEMLPSGDERGLDPREMTPADLEALNHQAMPASKAIRLHCVECSGCSAVEARMCVTVGCNLWPFRLGVSPWKAERQLTEEQREAARERGRALARKSDARVGAAVNLTGNLEGTAGAGISASSANSSSVISGRAA